jgi:subtilase family serine protease
VVLGIDERILDRRTVPLLDVGGSSVIDFQWSPRESDGTLWVSIDPGHSISEGSETDNDVSVQLRVVPAKADLWVNGTSLAFEPTEFADGDVVHMGIDVANMGWVPVNGVEWSLSVDGEERARGDLAEGIGPQEVHHQVMEWTVARGDHVINVSVTHPGEEIGEYPDFATTTVWVPARGDLAFSGTPSVEPPVVPFGGSFNLTFEVVNVGETTVPVTKVHIVVEGTLEESVGIGPLPPNATATVSRSFNATSVGTGSISLIIDPDDDVREGNETNNIVDLAYEVVDHDGDHNDHTDGGSDWYWTLGLVLSVAVVLALYLVFRRTRAE